MIIDVEPIVLQLSTGLAFFSFCAFIRQTTLGGKLVAGQGYERIVLLNRLVSRSTSRAPQEHKPPVHAGEELFGILAKRVSGKKCIEYLDPVSDDDDDEVRLKANKACNFIRIAELHTVDKDGWKYVTCLIDYIDNSVTSFPVLHISSYEGRDLAGDEDERGSFTAHMVVRLPKPGTYDDGSYRCVIEAVSNVTRRNIEFLVCRQLRRIAKLDAWTFSVKAGGKDAPDKMKPYRYHPKLELFADVGRSLFAAGGQKQLSHMIFTNRSEKQAIAQATAVSHEDLFATVEYKISAKQGPEEPAQRAKWVSSIRDYFEKRGYETKMYFRHLKGLESGPVHPSLQGATDLLMCPRSTITTAAAPHKWVGKILPEIRDEMRKLLDKDELWERAK